MLQPLWQAAQAGQVRLVSSELLVIETLVGPLKSGDARLVAAYEGVFAAPELRIVPITRPVLREAARLRAALPALRTPDAIHAATALLQNCALFVTNDVKLSQISGLSIAVLEIIRTAP